MKDVQKAIVDYFKEQNISISEKDVEKITKKLEKRIAKSSKKLAKKIKKEFSTKSWWKFWEW